MKTMIPAIMLACLVGMRADSQARGQDRFYAVIFGVQDGRNRCREAHTFAHFARVRTEFAEVELVDQATISWLPTSGIVRLYRRPEPGTNHPLKKSIEDVGPGHNIAQWGPFEIKEELFYRAKKQQQFLESGAVLYKAVDFFARPRGLATNCEHAVLDIGLNPGDRPIRTGTAHGHHGSYTVAEHLKDWMISPHKVHDWLNASLDLNRYPIARNGLTQPVQHVMAPPGQRDQAIAQADKSVRPSRNAKNPETLRKSDTAVRSTGVRPEPIDSAAASRLAAPELGPR